VELRSESFSAEFILSSSPSDPADFKGESTEPNAKRARTATVQQQQQQRHPSATADAPVQQRSGQPPLFNPPSQEESGGGGEDEFDAMLEADAEFGRQVAASQDVMMRNAPGMHEAAEDAEMELELVMDSQAMPDPNRKQVRAFPLRNGSCRKIV
jgi:hypothetical protein